MANPFLAGPGVTQTGDYATQSSMLERKQKIIDAMLNAQMPKGQMIGNSYVAPSFLESLAAGLKPIVGRYMDNKQEAKRGELALGYQKGMKDSFEKLSTPGADGTVPRQQVIEMMISQYPEVRARGAEEMKKLDAMDTPFMRQFGLSGGQGGGVAPGQGSPVGAPQMDIPTEALPGGRMSAPADLSGVQPPSGMPGNAPSGGPQVDRLAQVFPNLSRQEVLSLMMADPSGKLLTEANVKRNAPIVAGNNVYQPQPGGRIGNAPGSVEAMARAEGAQAAAKAPYQTPVRIDTGNGEQVMRMDQFVNSAGGGGGGGGQFRLPAKATPNNFVIPPAQQRQADQGRKQILEQELRTEKDPRNIEPIKKELAGTGGDPNLPGINSGFGPAQKSERQGSFESDLGYVKDLRATASKSSQALKSIGEIQKTLKGGTFSGAYANVQERGAAFFGPLGIPVDMNKLTNTQAVNAFVNNLVIPQVKQLGFNPTDSDRQFIVQMVGNAANDPAAFDKILGVLKKEHQSNVDTFNRADKHLRDNKGLGGFDYEFGSPASKAEKGTKESPMTPAEYRAFVKGNK